MKTTAEHDGFAGYFNIDNGTGRFAAFICKAMKCAAPIFEQWFAALKDITPGVITIRNTGGTDHQSYDAVGLPGFQFIQDEMDYETRTHHSNMDVYDRIQQQTWSRWPWWKPPSSTTPPRAPTNSRAKNSPHPNQQAAAAEATKWGSQSCLQPPFSAARRARGAVY